MPDRRQQEYDLLLDRARGGQGQSLGELLERYRNYLYVVARTQIDLHLSVRASPSDVVQETFLRAARQFQSFRGDSEGELLSWLRRILARSIVNAYAHHVRSRKRSIHRDRPIRLNPAQFDESSRRIDSALAASCTSPSAAAIEHEDYALVADRLAQLPKQYREVIILRNLEGLPFEEVAQRMGKTSVAVRQLWTRAIRRLKLPSEKE
jgi:RNA polymerase sigma-70 factor (ECF subfamily)